MGFPRVALADAADVADAVDVADVADVMGGAICQNASPATDHYGKLSGGILIKLFVNEKRSCLVARKAAPWEACGRCAHRADDRRKERESKRLTCRIRGRGGNVDLSRPAVIADAGEDVVDDSPRRLPSTRHAGTRYDAEPGPLYLTPALLPQAASRIGRTLKACAASPCRASRRT